MNLTTREMTKNTINRVLEIGKEKKELAKAINSAIQNNKDTSEFTQKMNELNEEMELMEVEAATLTKAIKNRTFKERVLDDLENIENQIENLYAISIDLKSHSIEQISQYKIELENYSRQTRDFIEQVDNIL